MDTPTALPNVDLELATAVSYSNSILRPSGLRLAIECYPMFWKLTGRGDGFEKSHVYQNANDVRAFLMGVAAFAFGVDLADDPGPAASAGYLFASMGDWQS